MVLGIFFLIVFIGFLIFFYKISNDIPKRWTRLCVAVIGSFIFTALITFGAAKELASLKFLFS